MKIAVIGCLHGKLANAMDDVARYETRNQCKVDLVLICGDVQTMRNREDLQSMACPDKFKKMEQFQQYYNGNRQLSCPVLFIGGNHESSLYLSEMPYGGWVCENMYYLGRTNMVQCGNLRIGGLSGIYKEYNYGKGYTERSPFNEQSKRSIYHQRRIEVLRMKLYNDIYHMSQDQEDKVQDNMIFLSHDWPQGIYKHASDQELQSLYKYKSFLRPEIESCELGSPASQEILRCLKPQYWFAAHMHCRFEVSYPHGEIRAELESESEQRLQSSKPVTQFLALDKCLPRRQYMEVIDVENVSPEFELKYDICWLAVLKATIQYESLDYNLLPNEQDLRADVFAAYQVLKESHLDLAVKPYARDPLNSQSSYSTNPQTLQFLQLISYSPVADSAQSNPNEIVIDDDI
ncbi:hypothetical protein MP228_003351 [Amoeboaphelidium protococcarum]|nr:hypothetical protein MP228_003351 [Amoeboaphelidium protococcarum]